ncbi:MAG: helix-turn-helix transcriptional regulator [Glaciecola sp.]|jgi:DNA-binding CsgD family transcriptional regulator
MNPEFRTLSPREREVMFQISTGKTNRSIGDTLFISERTVKFHCANIFKKLNVKNRTTLISRYLDDIKQLH